VLAVAERQPLLRRRMAAAAFCIAVALSALAAGLLLAGRRGGEQRGGVWGFCAVFPSGDGSWGNVTNVSSFACRFRLEGAPAAVSALRLGGWTLSLGETVAGERVEGHVVAVFPPFRGEAGAGGAYVEVAAYTPRGGAPTALVAMEAPGPRGPGVLGLPTPPRGAVAETRGEAPVVVQLPAGRGRLYLVVSTGGLCSPVVEAYRGLEPAARVSYRAETMRSSSPLKIAVLLPPGATAARVWCAGGGRARVWAAAYPAGTVELTLLGPRGGVVASTRVPLLWVPMGAVLLAPPPEGP